MSTLSERGRAVTVRHAVADDTAHVAEALAQAFHDDPLVTWAQPVPGKRAAGFKRWCTPLLRLAPGRRETYTTPDHAGAAIWSPPGEWPLTAREQLAALPGIVWQLRLRRAVPVLRFLAAADRLHPDEPHWYLDVLGTRPASQSTGIGSALLRPVLDRCDEEGVPVWTYSSNPRNLSFYHRHGFVVLDELRLPLRGIPPIFPIRRPPRP